ncbi:MAG TPA: FecR family protein, partial [Bacteroidales bacterium]|nr:FecR family protein [Bacteroidales bacterium]
IAAIVIVALLTGAMLSYLFFSKKNENPVSYYQVKAPLGGRSELTLPDGSVVWLNAGSSIRYDNRFNERNRNLYLEGEGYFKVAKNKKLPFIVKTGFSFFFEKNKYDNMAPVSRATITIAAILARFFMTLVL